MFNIFSCAYWPFVYLLWRTVYSDSLLTLKLCCFIIELYGSILGFPRSSVGKESACSAGNPGSIPGLGRSPGEGNGNPLQCPCLENHGQRSLEGYIPWGPKESGTTERLTLTYLFQIHVPYQIYNLQIFSLIPQVGFSLSWIIHNFYCCCSLVTKSCPTPWTAARQAPLSMGFPRKNTGVGCYFLLQCILPTQGLNLLLLHGQVGSLPLSHQVVVVVVYSLSRVGLLQPCGPQHSRLLCPWDFPGRNTGVGGHFLLHWIFPTQVSCTAGRFFTHWATFFLQGSS